MSDEELKRIASVWFDEVINKRRLDAIDEVFAPRYVHRGPRGRVMNGPAEAKAFAAQLLEAFEDRHTTVHEQLVSGDTVVTRFHSTGTHTGPLRGMPARGRTAPIEGIVISRIEDGKIVEDWELTDQFGFLQALGVIATGGEASPGSMTGE